MDYKIGLRAIYQKNIRTAIIEARQNGFEVLEIHLSAPQFQPEKYSKRELKTLANFARKNNILLQVHASLESSLLFLNPHLRQAAKLQFLETIKFCQALGARCLTLHPGSVYGYHASDGVKIKNDDEFRKAYCSLFEDGLKFVSSAKVGNLIVCIENTDNFNTDYRKILGKYLRQGKLFLTLDIRKLFSFNNIPQKEQKNFVQKNKSYVKNIHISSPNSAHGIIGKNEKELIKYLEIFKNKDIPLIFEVLPLKAALESKKNLEFLMRKVN
jgi:endonuclease IV